jgi:hypothetical protein
MSPFVANAMPPKKNLQDPRNFEGVIALKSVYLFKEYRNAAQRIAVKER